MRPRIVSSVLLLAIALMAQPLTAQVDLTDTRTAEDKWARSVYLNDVMSLALLAHGKSLGQTAEQIAEWAVGFAAPSWGDPGSGWAIHGGTGERSQEELVQDESILGHIKPRPGVQDHGLSQGDARRGGDQPFS